MKLLFYTMIIYGFFLEGCTYTNGCEIGYYYENEKCNRCPANCTKCSSGLSCTECKAGNYGTSCLSSCSDNCHDKECSITTGQCLSCKTGYFMDEKRSCVKCPNNCTTCKSNTFCFACKNGYKGESCQDSCFDCEIDSRCDKNTGYCLDRCRRGFSGELCNIKCDLKCTSCDRLIQSECISCAQERYGLNCNEKCSLNCLNNSCTDIDGVCTDGCVTGYWGGMCNNKCSKDCKDNKCNITDGGCFKGKQSTSSEDRKPVAANLIIAIGVAFIVVILTLTIICSVYLKRNRATIRFKNCNDHTSPSGNVHRQCMFGLCSIVIEDVETTASDPLEPAQELIQCRQQSDPELPTNPHAECDQLNEKSQTLEKDESDSDESEYADCPESHEQRGLATDLQSPDTHEQRDLATNLPCPETQEQRELSTKATRCVIN